MKRFLLLPLALASLFCVAAELQPADAAAKSKSCKQVDVKFKSGAEGSAVHIRALNVGCRKARKVVRSCVKGKVSAGWSAAFSADRTKLILRSGKRKITYMPAGGGGCVAI